MSVSPWGAKASANVGMSNDSWGENPHRRISKASAARSLRSGLVGPKPRPRGVGDGQQVDSPAPLVEAFDHGGMPGGTGSDQTRVVQAGREPGRTPGVDREASTSATGDGSASPRHLHGHERPAVGASQCPYRKPTQVDRSSRPRRTSEPWLRNSAK